MLNLDWDNLFAAVHYILFRRQSFRLPCILSKIFFSAACAPRQCCVRSVLRAHLVESWQGAMWQRQSLATTYYIWSAIVRHFFPSNRPEWHINVKEVYKLLLLQEDCVILLLMRARYCHDIVTQRHCDDFWMNQSNSAAQSFTFAFDDKTLDVWFNEAFFFWPKKIYFWLYFSKILTLFWLNRFRVLIMSCCTLLIKYVL